MSGRGSASVATPGRRITTSPPSRVTRLAGMSSDTRTRRAARKSIVVRRTARTSGTGSAARAVTPGSAASIARASRTVLTAAPAVAAPASRRRAG